MSQKEASDKWKAKNLANGLCEACGLPAAKGERRGAFSRYCREHQLAHADYMREYMKRRRNEQRSDKAQVRA